MRDTRSRNGTPDSGWDDDEDDLDLAGLGKTECQRSWLLLHFLGKNICNSPVGGVFVGLLLGCGLLCSCCNQGFY